MTLPSSILRLLQGLDSNQCSLPPTIFYNEGWMLRIVLDAAAHGCLPEVMPKGGHWYSEAQLRTPFGRDKGRKHEGNTHADGVVGDFSYINDTKSGLEILNDAKRFSVYEAKMYSPLSSGTKNAPNYDQAARNVACIAYALQNAGRRPELMDCVGFYVVAPESEIERRQFEHAMQPDSIRSRIDERVQQFTGIARDTLRDWQAEWFNPLVSKMDSEQSLKCVSWEELLEQILASPTSPGPEITEFYEKCKQHNRAVGRSSNSNTDRPVRGMECLVRSGRRQGQRVRICFAGPINSRVYRDDSSDEAFLIANANLQKVPEAEQTPAPHNPIPGCEYAWAKTTGELIRVRVVNVGDCNSRVTQVGCDDNSFKVPNHQLSTFE
jgi:hypothetical protein